MALKEPTLELANDLIRDRLESQKAGIERIETKATLLLGFAVVGAQVVLARDARGGWLAIALVLYALALAAGLVAIALYEHEFPPDPGRVVDAYLDVERAHLLDVLVRTRAEAFSANARHALIKRRAWFALLGLLSAAVASSAIALWRK